MGMVGELQPDLIQQIKHYKAKKSTIARVEMNFKNLYYDFVKKKKKTGKLDKGVTENLTMG